MTWSEVSIGVEADQAKTETKDLGENARLDQLLNDQQAIEKSVETLRTNVEDQSKAIDSSKRDQADLRVAIKQLGQVVKLLLPKMEFPLPGSVQTRRMAQ